MLKLFAAAFTFVFASAMDCPETLQVRCVDDFRIAYPICQKAAAAGGSDSAADLQCMKYYSKVKTECWPCICQISNAEHLNVSGCTTPK